MALMELRLGSSLMIRHITGDWDYTPMVGSSFSVYPLYYRSIEHIYQAVSSFDKIVTWHNNRRALGNVLVKCLYNEPTSVPHTLVLSQGEIHDRGWN
jgi:hypothetical protein